MPLLVPVTKMEAMYFPFKDRCVWRPADRYGLSGGRPDLLNQLRFQSAKEGLPGVVGQHLRAFLRICHAKEVARLDLRATTQFRLFRSNTLAEAASSPPRPPGRRSEER